MAWENGGIPSQIPSHLSPMEWVQPCLQQGQENSQCSEFLFNSKVQSFGAHKWLLSSLTGHPVILACSQLLFISDSLLDLVCGACMATGHAAVLDAWSSALWTENTWTHRPGHQKWARERCSLLEAMERTGKCIMQVQVMSKSKRASLIPWVILGWMWD